MLLIKEDQIKVFASIIDKDFEERMIESMKENFPENLLPENQFKEFIVQSISEAKNYGFTLETDIEEYLYLKYKYSVVNMYGNFLQAETIDILTFPDRESGVKLTLLINFFERQ